MTVTSAEWAAISRLDNYVRERKTLADGNQNPSIHAIAGKRPGVHRAELRLEDLERVVAIAERARKDSPCDCPLVGEEQIGPHTVREHESGSCGGVSVPAPCGGCFDCILAQIAYREQKTKERTDGA